MYVVTLLYLIFLGPRLHHVDTSRAEHTQVK